MCARAMLIVLKQGGLGKGGLNFDAKPRRGSFDGVDLLYAHIGGMDAFARGLLMAHEIIQDGLLEDFLHKRYASFTDGLGKKIMTGEETFDSLEKWILGKGEPALKSGRQEMLESLFMTYV
jgi:xylose isomerase